MASSDSPATSHPDPAAGAARLAELRGTIDNLDAAIVHLLAERFKCTQEVGRLKARHGMAPADPAREAEQIARLRRLAHESSLDPAFAEKFLNFVVEEVVRHHRVLARDHQRGAQPGAQADAQPDAQPDAES